jgi:hypothetical protein
VEVSEARFISKELKMNLETASPPTLERLRQMYRSNKIQQSLFDRFAARRRDRRMTSVARIEGFLRIAGYPTPRSVVIEFLKELEDCGCGKFVLGRRGHESRFTWHVSMTSVGRAASGVQDWIAPYAVEAVDAVPSAVQIGAPTTHRVVIGTGRIAEITSPHDLTDGEALRIAEFALTLASPTMRP